MSYSVSVTVSTNNETKELISKLNRMSSVDKHSVFNAIGEGLRTSTVERFQNQAAPGGSRWEPSIRAIAEGGKTLIQTTTLRNSIHVESSSEGVTIGTNDIRAATLQFGDERTIRAKNAKYLRFKGGDRKWHSVKQVKIKIPARPFLGISESDEREIRDTIEEALDV